MSDSFEQNTIGGIVKNKRIALGYSLEEVESELKIKIKYLKAIEENKFNRFEYHTKAKGFIKNYANMLELNYGTLLAMYRRDVENIGMKRKINFKPDDEEEVQQKESKILKRFSQINLTKSKIYLSMGLVILLFTGIYVFRATRLAFDEPYMRITAPFELETGYAGKIEYDKDTIVIKGETEKNSTITVNEEVLQLKPGFEFETVELPFAEETLRLIIKAENNFGTESKIDITLTKPDKTIKVMKTQLKIMNSPTQITFKADGIIRYEATAQIDEVLNFETNRNIQIITSNPENIQLIINDVAYPLDGNDITYENKGLVIEKALP